MLVPGGGGGGGGTSGGGLAMCSIYSFFIGFSEVQWSAAPRGDCAHCCPLRESDIQYKLYTRESPARWELLTPGNRSSLARSRFDPAAPTVVYLFGFSESDAGASSVAIRDAYLRRGGYNVVLVDWTNLVLFPWYVSAVRNTRYMGDRLAEFVAFLVRGGARAGALHLIGFSLGAEAAGFAGKRLKARGIVLGRITGLDPAYPGYSLTDASGHLARGDALFVDVVHTNPGVFGFLQPIGDVDFYPNGNGWPVQPGCLPHELLADRQLGQLYGCSHNRSWRLYAESVRSPRGFPATRCRRWRGALPPCRFTADGYLGHAAPDSRRRGKMYLITNPVPPYARGGP